MAPPYLDSVFLILSFFHAPVRTTLDRAQGGTSVGAGPGIVGREGCEAGLWKLAHQPSTISLRLARLQPQLLPIRLPHCPCPLFRGQRQKKRPEEDRWTNRRGAPRQSQVAAHPHHAADQHNSVTVPSLTLIDALSLSRQLSSIPDPSSYHASCRYVDTTVCRTIRADRSDLCENLLQRSTRPQSTLPTPSSYGLLTGNGVAGLHMCTSPTAADQPSIIEFRTLLESL